MKMFGHTRTHIHNHTHTQLVRKQTCIHHLDTVPTYSTYMDGRMDGWIDGFDARVSVSMCKSIPFIVGITEPAALQLHCRQTCRQLGVRSCATWPSMMPIAKRSLNAVPETAGTRGFKLSWVTGRGSFNLSLMIKITCPQAPCIFKHRFNKNMTQMWVGYEKSWSIWANTLDLVHLGTLQ
jgi:hypothetical protein